jgi:hypothetical protein
MVPVPEDVSRSATARQGLPDPRDKGAYPRALAPLTQWAWEFLRRRPDYRIRWERLARDRGDRCCEVVDGYRVQSWRSPLEALRDDFKICPSPLNPDLAPHCEHSPLFAGLETVMEVLEVGAIPLPNKIAIEFDLDLPVDPQLASARRLLIERSRAVAPSRKLPLNKFPVYLRLLDFEEEGASDPEIGRHLFPNYSGDRLRDAIRKNSEAARRWRDDHLSIALHFVLSFLRSPERYRIF